MKGWKVKMGSWDETCGLSNLPIRCGERIICIPLKQNFSFSDEGIYPDGRFRPFAFPIRGIYDDYGDISEITFSAIYSEFLKDKSFYKKNDMSSYKELVFDSVEDFISELCDGNLYTEEKVFAFNEQNLPTHEIKKVLLTKMFIHESLYNILCTEMGSRIPYKNIKTFEELYREKIEGALIEYSENILYTPFNYYFSISNEIGENMANIVAYYFRENRISLKDAVDVIFSQYVFYIVLLYMRKGYLSYSGRGSQTNEYYLHKLMAQWIIDKCKNVEDEFSPEDFPDSEALKETLFF